MDSHPTLRLFLILLITLLSPIANAYPERYPRIGPVAHLEIGDATNDSPKSFRLVPNTTANEYLAVWESPSNVLNALRLDGNTLEPFAGQPSSVLLDARGANPHNPNLNFGALSSFDIVWDNTRNRYFLAAFLTSAHPDGSQNGASNETYAGFVHANLETIQLIEFSRMPDCEAIGNAEGLRAVHRPGTNFIYVFRTFGPDRPPLIDLLDHGNPVRTSGVCGQIVSGITGNAAANYLNSPATVMKLTDVVPGNGLSPFYMTDLAAEYDAAFNHFVLVSTIAEATVGVDPDAGSYSVRQRSDIVGQIVGPALLTENGATTLRKVSAQNHFNDTIVIGTNIQTGPDNWTAHSPKLIMGPLAENSATRNWLVTFRGIGPGVPNPLPRLRVNELWSHRITTTSADAMNAPTGADRLLSGNNHPQTAAEHKLESQGLWIPEVARFLNVWGSCSLNCYLFGNSLKNAGGLHAAVKDLPLSDGQVSRASAHIIRSFDGNSLFAVTSMENRIDVQKINLAWMNLSTSAEIVGESEISVGAESTLLVTISRSGGVLDGPSDTHPGTGTVPATVFDSGSYRLHLTMPENLTVTQVDPLLATGDIETGFSGDTTQITLNEGESKTFSFTVRNDNASTTAGVDDIHIALESLGDGIEYDASDDTFVIPVTLAGMPDEVDLGDGTGGDGTGGDGTGGDGTGGDGTGGDGTGGDGTGGDGTGGDGTGGDGTGGDGAGGDGSGKRSGGGAFGWLLLGLAATGIRRRVI